MTIEEDERVRGDVVVIGAPARIDGEMSGDVLVVVALLASVVVFAGRGSVERIARCARTEPVKSGVVGFLTQVLFVPLLVAGILRLVISNVGIPLLLLLPFVVIAACLVMMVGFTGVVHGVGAWFGSRTDRPGAAPYRSVWVGIALLLIPTMAGEAMDLAGAGLRLFAVVFALTGLLVEYAAWTAGFGALILNRFGAALPPPMSPPESSPAPPPPDVPEPPRDMPLTPPEASIDEPGTS